MWRCSSRALLEHLENFIGFGQHKEGFSGDPHINMELGELPHGSMDAGSLFNAQAASSIGGGRLALYPQPAPWQDYQDADGVRYRIFPGLAAQAWDQGRGLYRVLADPEVLQRHLSLAQLVIVFGMIPVLRVRNLFGLHGGCVVKDGLGILLTAESGGGKSSTVLSLARSGMTVVGDERIFTWQNAGGDYMAASLSPVIKVAESSLQSLHDAYSPGSPLGEYAGDLYFRLDRAGFDLANQCSLGAVCSLAISNQTGTKWRPVSPSSILSSLFPVTMPVSDQKAAQATFSHLMEMLNRLPCFRIDLGADPSGIKQAICQIAQKAG